METEQNLIFLSYTTADREIVSEIGDAMNARQIQTWMDYKRLKAGQNWDFEIRKALDKSSIIIIFISNNSVAKNGYVQKELRIALSKSEDKIIDDIYIIPVLIDDDVVVPEQIRHLQFIKYSDGDFINKLCGSILHQIAENGYSVEQQQSDSEITWSAYTYSDFRDGLPGYSAEMRLFRFSSEVYPQINQIGEYIKGQLLQDLFLLRSSILDQDPENLNYGQERYSRTNTIDIHSVGPTVIGRTISILFSVHSYYAGAAHPNTCFRSFNFFIDPVFDISNITDIFIDEDEAFAVIQSETRRQLRSIEVDDEPMLDDEMLLNGTQSWDHFQVFIFGKSQIEFIFEPYQVGPYAAGPQQSAVPYEKILRLMKSQYRSALNLRSYDLD